MAVSNDVARVAVAGIVLVGVGILAGSKNGTGLVAGITGPYESAITNATTAGQKG